MDAQLFGQFDQHHRDPAILPQTDITRVFTSIRKNLGESRGDGVDVAKGRQCANLVGDRRAHVFRVATLRLPSRLELALVTAELMQGLREKTPIRRRATVVWAFRTERVERREGLCRSIDSIGGLGEAQPKTLR